MDPQAEPTVDFSNRILTQVTKVLLSFEHLTVDIDDDVDDVDDDDRLVLTNVEQQLKPTEADFLPNRFFDFFVAKRADGFCCCAKNNLFPFCLFLLYYIFF